MNSFTKELRALVNKYSIESESDTPDSILAEYIFGCLAAYNKTVKARDKWFGVDMWAENKKIKPLNKKICLGK